ncbi:MAG: glycine--tRNA ligase subunit beta [Coriobacteriia bacterium]|nr:glycine--tRNA ligase subunit beta [Coriobacteriia bacterium]
MSRDLLLEIGVEEVPSAPLYDAVTQLKARAATALDAARLSYGTIASYGAPRRLALVVTGLTERQSDLSLKVKGPAVKAAFDADGNPTKAAEGFARSRGLAVEDLVTEEAGGGEYLFALVEEAGRGAEDVLPDLLATLIGDLDWAKSMRWGSGTTRFIRPVRWIVALYGSVVVPVAFGGVEAGRTTVGHRFLAGPIDIDYAGVYHETLRSVMVVADAEERAESIRDAIDAAAGSLGARAVVPEKTFAEVVNLVEWPSVGIGRFDDEFLAVPREIVEEAMESHQRYFPVENAAGDLLARFLVVHNGDPGRTDAIIAGHERVIRARLADAAFFYREDLARPLESYVHDLESIVFHDKLGSLGAKVARIEALARSLAAAADAPPDEAAYAVRAAHLAKADLVTHAVIEFTSLQGVMGMRYALAAGEAPEVAEAIVDHYRPRFAGDALPRSRAGRLVSIADKLDTIVGIFAIGQGPTGSADPYALRRSAIGILTMIVDGGVRLDLDRAIADALAGYEGVIAGLDPNEAGPVVKTFFDGRLAVMLRDRGFAHDEVDAVMAVASADPADTLERTRALAAFRATDAGADLSVAFKRAGNLADASAGTSPDASIMGAEESVLADALDDAYGRIRTLMTVDGDYDAALAALADLRAPVDAFFEAVLVMDPDERLRRNRLALLNRLTGLFADFADFGRLTG